jgi:hypothetical protein
VPQLLLLADGGLVRPVKEDLEKRKLN